MKLTKSSRSAYVSMWRNKESIILLGSSRGIVITLEGPRRNTHRTQAKKQPSGHCSVSNASSARNSRRSMTQSRRVGMATAQSAQEEAGASLGAQRRSAEATAQSAQEEAGAFLGAQRRSAEGVLLPPPAYHYLPEMWPRAMYQYWGYYGPVLAAHVGSFHSGKRKRQVISDACTNCRRSKLKCDEEKPCTRCIMRGRAADCASWREDAAKASPQNETDDQSKPQRGDPAKSRVRTARPSLLAAALKDFALSTPTEPVEGGGRDSRVSASKKGGKRQSPGVARNSLARTDAACSWTGTSNVLSGEADGRQTLMPTVAPAHRQVEASDDYLDPPGEDSPFSMREDSPFSLRGDSPFSASKTMNCSQTDSEADFLLEYMNTLV